MRPIVIAEIGCNHMGDFNIACDMIATAADCGADVVKFQKRTPKELLTPEQYNAPHPVEYNSFGKTYGEHREFLEFNVAQHQQLKEVCESHGVIYSCSVWDLTAAEEILTLEPEIIKIPSACNLNKPLLEYVCGYFPGEIHVSLGMTTKEEMDMIRDFFADKGNRGSVVLYACTSGYPVPFEDVKLGDLKWVHKLAGYHDFQVGYSGHHNGIAIDIAAYALGAQYIERHFTLNRTWKGTDHAASLEPQGLRKMVRDLKAVSQAMGTKDGILEIEKPQREKLKKVVWE